MKKTLVVMMAFVLGMAITSCKQGPKTDGASEEEAAANPTETLNNLVEKAKSEGANWSVDQWKDAYKQAFVVMTPMLKGMYEISQAIQSAGTENADTAAISKAMAKAKELEEQFGSLGEIVAQFDSIGKTYPNGKAVSDDKEFQKELMKEAGLPEDFDM